VKDESTDKKKEFRAQRDDEYTNEDDDEYFKEGIVLSHTN
jgi:hypothetical protein